MAPRLYIFLIVLTVLPGIGLAQSFSKNDSLRLIHQDSIALKHYLSKPDFSLNIANQTLAEAIAAKNVYLQGYSYYIISKAYWVKANYKASAENGFKALSIYEDSPYKAEWAKALISLGRILTDLQNFKHAETFIEQGLRIARNNNLPTILADAYREKSKLLIDLKQYDSALYYANVAYNFFEKQQDSLNLSILHSRRARIYFAQKDFKKSAAYNKTSIDFNLKTNNKRALGIAYYQAALDVIHLSQYDSAVKLLQKSIEVNQEVKNLSALIRSHSLLGDLYNEKKQPALAVPHLKKASQYKDTIYNTERSGQIQEMLSLYDLRGKERAIKALEEDNKIKEVQVKVQWIFVASLLICVILLGLLVYFQKRYRKLLYKTNLELANNNRAIEQQKEEIQSQAESLQGLNQLKSKLFSVISHDLRGPIGNLQALLDLLSKKQLTPEEFMAISQKLKTNVDITQRTLENLLNWSLSQMEGLKIEPKTIDVQKTIHEACALMEEVAENKRINIENKIDDEVFVKADYNQLQLVLRNLIHNAIKFSKPSHQVLISATRQTDVCKISVKDFGVGMSAVELESVVNPKTYFSRNGTMQEKGTGIGLLLCREFIKLNGGEIEIFSSTNQGTEVTFTLPLAVN